MTTKMNPKPGIQTSSFISMLAAVIALQYQGFESQADAVKIAALVCSTVIVVAYIAARAARAVRRNGN